MENNQLATNPMTLLELAVNGDADLTKIEKLMDLQERWEKNQSRKSFLHALTVFQSSCPVIPKKSEAKFNSKVQYTYADLATIIETIKECLKDAGLSYRWETDDKGY